jgi:hypothetical protein
MSRQFNITDALSRSRLGRNVSSRCECYQGKATATSVATAAVMRARRLMRRDLARRRAIKSSSSIVSSPASMLRVPRAAIAIQVFSRDCKSPKPAIQMGKKTTRRRARGAFVATNTNATPTPTVNATTPNTRRLRRSRSPMFAASSNAFHQGESARNVASGWPNATRSPARVLMTLTTPADVATALTMRSAGAVCCAIAVG